MNRFLVTALALVVFASGCASQEESASSSTSDVTVGQTQDGDVVTDDAGMSLYTFDPDTTTESTCYDACEAHWPPALVAAEDVVAAPFSTTVRRDGSLQLTLNGDPLYRFAGDHAPGDINGDGLGGVWHLARPVATPKPVDVTMLVDTLDGQVIADLQGMSLYTFDVDTTTESTCYDACEAHWPPALVPTEATGAKLPKDYSTTTRRDGSVQLTLNGHPLYLFAGDSAVGDINGDGLGGVWHLARP